jgi:hypothetical protein
MIQKLDKYNGKKFDKLNNDNLASFVRKQQTCYKLYCAIRINEKWYQIYTYMYKYCIALALPVMPDF